MTPRQEPEGLSRQAVSSVGWTTVQAWALRVSGLVTMLILARQLSPAEFGLVAIAMALPPILQPLADLGLSTYMLRASAPSPRTFHTYFWYSLGAGALVTGLLAAAAPLVGALLDAPEVVPIGVAVAPLALLIVLGAVPLTILRRSMRFRAIAIQAVVAGVASQIVAIALALSGAGVWAIVWQSLTVQAVGLVLAWASARFLPRLEFSRSDFVSMTRFGVQVAAPGLLGPAAIWAVNAIIVSLLGVAALGILDIARRLIVLVNDLTMSSLGFVSTVLFSRIRDEPERLRAGYARAVTTTHAIVTPVMAFVAVGAPFLVPLIFGDQWAASIPLVQLLAIAGAFAAATGVDNSLFIAAGRPGAWFAYYVAIDAVTVLATLAAARSGLVAFALGYLAVGVAASLTRWVLVARVLAAPWRRIAAPFARVGPPTLLATAAGAGVVALTGGWPPLVVLTLAGVAGVIVYLPALRMLAPAAWNDLAALTRTALQRTHPTREQVPA